MFSSRVAQGLLTVTGQTHLSLPPLAPPSGQRLHCQLRLAKCKRKVLQIMMFCPLVVYVMFLVEAQ